MTDPTQEPLNIGEMVLHHTADAWTIDLDLYFWHPVIHLPRWPDVHIFGLTLNLSPTKHVVFMVLAAAFVFGMMWFAARSLRKTQAQGKAPKGFAGPGSAQTWTTSLRNEALHGLASITWRIW